MNVAIILPCLSEGGAERIGGILSKCLSEEMNIFIFLFHNKITYDYGGKIIDLDYDNVNKKYQNLGMIGKLITLPVKYFEFIVKLKRMKKKYHIQCSISFLERPNILNLLSRHKDKIIISVRSVRSSRKDRFYEWVENRVIKLIYNKSDKIISISEGVRIDLINNFGINPNKIRTIYNFLDIEAIQTGADEILEEDIANQLLNKKVIVTVGRLHPIKNQKLLINNFAIVKKKIKNLKLIIVGSGPEEIALKKMVRKLGVENDVIFIGYNKNPFKYIKRADLFVLCSKSEGYGNVILEAMACGTPVISTDCPSGPHEILLNEPYQNHQLQKTKICSCGVLVPLQESWDNISLMSEAITLMLTDLGLSEQINKAALEYVQNFSIKEIKKQWIEEIQTTCI